MANAVRSLYNATLDSRGSVGGKSRSQRIHTPVPLLDMIHEFWPEGIALDPAGSPEGLVVADRIICPPDDGLVLRWPERTFVNPPFGRLKPWMGKFIESWEVIMLVPVRTHRRWFRHALEESHGLVWLDPLKFHGYSSAFPAPLCLLYRGSRVQRLRPLAEAHGLTS